MNITPNTSPLSQQLYEQLNEMIVNAQPGERLPSEPKLAKQLGVSRATLREAMRTFETQGMIYRRQGVGTFVIQHNQVIESGLEVLESLETIAERIGLPVSMGDYEVIKRPASEEECQELAMKDGCDVVHVSRVIEAENRPVAYLIDILPTDLLTERELEREFSGSVLDLLLRKGEPLLTNSRTEISAVPVTKSVARAMGIQRGDVVLCFEATLFTADGKVVDYSHSYFLPGFFKFRVNRRVG